MNYHSPETGKRLVSRDLGPECVIYSSKKVTLPPTHSEHCGAPMRYIPDALIVLMVAAVVAVFYADYKKATRKRPPSR